MRVSLVTRHKNARFTPLALLYIKAALVDHAGLAAEDVTLLEFAEDADASLMADAIERSRPDVLGLSCYIWNIVDLMAAVAAVRAKRPAMHVVAGGPEVGPIGDVVLKRYPALDVVVKSEGEAPMVDLVTRWMRAEPIADVPGIWRRDAGAPFEHANAPIRKDLNTLSSPHLRGYVATAGRIVCVETQRGCVFTCSFCFYNKDLSIRNRRFNLDRVKAEIAYWLDQDIHQLYLMDPIFNLHAARAKEICRFIAERNHRRIPIHTEIWAEFLDDEMAALMKAAHFGFLEVGLQTTDDVALATVERRLKLQPFLDGVAALRKHGLPHEVQLIFGLPDDTMASFRQSVDFAARLQPDHLIANTLRVLPGTELWRTADRLGLEFEREPPYFVRSTPTMPAGELERGRMEARMVRPLWQSRPLRFLSRERGLTFSRIVEDWVRWRADAGLEESDDPETLEPQIERFISDQCDAHAIPREFYAAVARRHSATAPS